MVGIIGIFFVAVCAREDCETQLSGATNDTEEGVKLALERKSRWVRQPDGTLLCPCCGETRE